MLYYEKISIYVVYAHLKVCIYEIRFYSKEKHYSMKTNDFFPTYATFVHF
jgi:hypothetical protein